MVSTPAFSAVFSLLGPQFERATGDTLSIQYGLVGAQEQQIDAGALDLAIVPSPVLDDAIKKGKIVSTTRTTLARVVLGVGVRAGAPKPDLTSIDAFKHALLNATSVAYVTDEPTGKRIAKAFEGLGIADAMKARTSREKAPCASRKMWQAGT